MAPTTLQGEERRRERRLIIDGGGVDAGGMWPHFPILPIKRRRDGDLDCAVIAWRYLPPDVDDRPVTVYQLNLAEAMHRAEEIKQRTGQEKVSWGELLEGVEKLEYPDLDAFFDDGWMAD